jgi:diguanylate cyclase (GGDEF)-like protein
MRLFDGAKALMILYKDYRTLDRDERSDFFQAKFDYYQKYVEFSLTIACLSFALFILSDYIITGSFLLTLMPRLSIVICLLIYDIASHFLRTRAAKVFMDFFLGHAVMIGGLWVSYNLSGNAHAGEGIAIMNLLWFLVGFAAMPHETFISYLVFFVEIIISNSFLHYNDFKLVLVMECLFGAAVVLSQVILTLLYLDHFRIKQKLELAMVTDPLTQVYNRHLLEKIIAKNTIKDAAKDEQIAIAMLDIDNFKKINDDNGHYTGDLTLLYMGQKLAKETHDNDYVIRYGGEEFVIIFRNCDVNNACARMEQFRRDIENAKDTPVPFTISVGVSRYAGDYSKAVQNVDTALYKAKNTGRNKVVVV